MARHINHQQSHLEKCKPFLEQRTISGRSGGIQSSIINTPSAAPDRQQPGPSRPVIQQQINVTALTIQQQIELDDKYAMAVVASAGQK